jgi:hypothetical protein
MAGKIIIFCPECDTKVPDGFYSCPECHVRVDNNILKRSFKHKQVKRSSYHVGGFCPMPVVLGAVFSAGLIALMHLLLTNGDLTFLIIHYYLAGMFIVAASAYAARRAYSANFIHGVLTSIACGALLLGAYVIHGYLTGTPLEYPPKNMPHDALSIYTSGTIAAGAIGGCLGLVGK